MDEAGQSVSWARALSRLYETDWESESDSCVESSSRKASFQSLKLDKILAIPNPNTGIFNIAFDKQSVESQINVFVYTVDGKFIRKFNFSNQDQIKLDLSDLSEGLYTIRLEIDKQCYFTKAVILRN